MAGERLSGFSALAFAVIVLSAAIVLTRFGWYTALNSAIPLLVAALWVLVLALSTWGAGDLLWRRWAAPEDLCLERIVLQLVTGTAVLAGASGLLAVAHLLSPIALLIVLGAAGCHGALQAYHRVPRLFSNTPAARHWPWIVIAIAGGVSLAAATTFAPFYDQWHYHLGFPYQWLRAGSLVTFERHAYSFFPANMGLLYLYALAGPGAWAAQVTHWWMGALTAAGSAVIARRLGASVHGQVLAVAVFAATPSVVQLGALAGADLGVAAFATGAVIALLRLRTDADRGVRWAALAGGLSGLAAGAKYLALASFVVPAAIAVTSIALVGASSIAALVRRTLRPVLAFAVAVTVIAGPWLLRNVLQTGNPVYPYFARVFGETDVEGRGADEGVASAIGDFAVTRSTPATALSLGTFDRRGHAGDIGPVHLWLTPLICLWVWRGRRHPDGLIVFGVLLLGVVIWATGPPLGRYLLPSLALIAALAGAAWDEIVEVLATPLRCVFGSLLALVLVANCNPIRAEYLGDQLACFLGFQSDEKYLRRNCTQLEAIRAVNAKLPGGAKVLLVGEPRAYGIDREIVVEDPFRTPLLVELAEGSSSASEIVRDLRSLGITHLLWNGAEAERIAAAQGRDDFLACSSTARATLETFLAEEVTPVAAGRTWEICALAGD